MLSTTPVRSIRPGIAEVTSRRLTGRIGAEIAGVDLARSIDDDVVAAIRATLLAHQVVFFRNQKLDTAGQLAFARRLGPLTRGHPTIGSAPELPEVYDLDSASGAHADHWHTDVTFVQQPPAISVLRAVVLPSVGGDTLWANTVAAYASMPEELRALADRLRALHTNVHDYASLETHDTTADPIRAAHVAEFRSQRFETKHPVVRIHPETGERSLLLGGFAGRLVGLSAGSSRDLLRAFHEYVIRPEHCVRWSWRPGDVAVWDNRATQHYAVYDYAPERRQVHRVTVAGDIPVGVDGFRSVARAGDASAYLPEAA